MRPGVEEAFGTSVCSEHGRRDERAEATEVEDETSSMTEHERYHNLGQPDGSNDIDSRDRVELVQGRGLEGDG